MDDFKYFARKLLGDSFAGTQETTVLWKVNRQVNLGANKDSQSEPGRLAYVALSADLDEKMPDSNEGTKYWRISRDAFKKCWNENFDSLQKAELSGGEYYLERDCSEKP